jgi:hypothetical protein
MYRLSWSSIIVVLLVIAGGCTGFGNYGRLQRSREVDQIFKTFHVLSDYKYYFTGPAGRPDAIMGIRNEYSLETTQWTQFSPSDDAIKEAVESINFYHHGGMRFYPYGFYILDPNGNRLGIWYSIWDWTTVIIKENMHIEVFPPDRKDPFGNGDKPEKMKPY